MGTVLVAASACGGHATSSGDSSSTAGGAAGGGARELTPQEPALDTFPWFDSNGGSQVPAPLADQVLHLSVGGSPPRATLSTHNHVDLLSHAEAIGFSARASAPVRLLVSASNSLQSYDYFEAREQGTQWPVAPVEVSLEWQDYRVRLSEMMPVESADADGIPSFWLAFVVEHPEPVEVWLDEVRFFR